MSSSTQTGTFTLPDSRTISYAVTSPPSLKNNNNNHNYPTKETRTILLSNSLCAPYRSWDHLVPYLVNHHRFTVIRYDQPGHGHSSAPTDPHTTTFHTLAGDVRHLLSHLSISRLDTFLGDSMGAATGIFLAAAHPKLIRRLVVCDVMTCAPILSGNPDPFTPRVLDARANGGNMSSTTEWMISRWFAPDWPHRNPAEAARLREVMGTTTFAGLEACVAALTAESFDLRPRLADAGRGVEAALCIAGENDGGNPRAMEVLRKGIEEGMARKVELKIVKDAGHLPFVDNLDEFQAVVGKFLGETA